MAHFNSHETNCSWKSFRFFPLTFLAFPAVTCILTEMFPLSPLFLHFNKIVSSDFLLSSLLEAGNIFIKFSLGRKWIKRSPQGGGNLIHQKDNQQQEASNLPQPLPFSPLPTQSNVSCGFQVNHVFGSFHAANSHFTHSSKFFLQAFCVAWSIQLFLNLSISLRVRQSQVTLSSNSHFGKKGGGGEETEDFIAIITNQNTSECLNLLLCLFSSSTICQAERKQLNFSQAWLLSEVNNNTATCLN